MWWERSPNAGDIYGRRNDDLQGGEGVSVSVAGWSDLEKTCRTAVTGTRISGIGCAI